MSPTSLYSKFHNEKYRQYIKSVLFQIIKRSSFSSKFWIIMYLYQIGTVVFTIVPIDSYQCNYSYFSAFIALTVDMALFFRTFLIKRVFLNQNRCLHSCVSSSLLGFYINNPWSQRKQISKTCGEDMARLLSVLWWNCNEVHTYDTVILIVRGMEYDSKSL